MCVDKRSPPLCKHTGVNCWAKQSCRASYFEETPNHFPTLFSNPPVNEGFDFFTTLTTLRIVWPFMVCVLVGVKYLLGVRICVSLMTANTEHLVGCWPYGSSLEKGLFKSFLQCFNCIICPLIIQLVSLIMINLRFIHDVAWTKRYSFFFFFLLNCIPLDHR